MAHHTEMPPEILASIEVLAAPYGGVDATS